MAIYKGENLLASSANSDALVRNPDWGNAVSITSADLVAGYTCPADGIFVIASNAVALNTNATLTINGVLVALSRRSDTYNCFAQCQVAVSKNDVVRLTSGVDTPGKFVPYGLYTAPDTLVPHNYSQDEQFTGNYWIDGKKIYRRVYYSATNWANNAEIGTIQNVSNVVSITSVSRTSNNEAYQNYSDGSSRNDATFNLSTGKLVARRGAVFVNTAPAHVIIEYTKTTD